MYIYIYTYNLLYALARKFEIGSWSVFQLIKKRGNNIKKVYLINPSFFFF